jgi:hypothetical protein
MIIMALLLLLLPPRCHPGEKIVTIPFPTDHLDMDHHPIMIRMVPYPIIIEIENRTDCMDYNGINLEVLALQEM